MTPAHALLQTVAGWSGTVVALVDGARFDDARASLRGVGLSPEPLFLETPRRPAPVSGPFFVPLGPGDAARLGHLPGVEQACVMWNASVPAILAYRHFRGLNLAEIPLADPSTREPDGSGGELVLFRHWDPAVLALVGPVLLPDQQARLFGPLSRLAFYAVETGRVIQAAAPQNVAVPSGPIELTPAQISLVEARMVERSRRAIEAYLRRHAPAQTGAIDPTALQTFVVRASAEAARWGVASEAGFGRFAWLVLVTGGKFPAMPGVHAFVTDGQASPDDRLRHLMTAMSQHAWQGAHG